MNGAMKLSLLFIAAWSTTAALDSEEVRRTRWSYVFTALSRSSSAENVEEANNALVNAVGGALLTCDAGWTGQFCENPICSSRNTLTPSNINIYGRLVDMVILPNCVGSYQFSHDSLSNYTYINVNTDGGTPQIVVTNSNGTVMGTADANGGPLYQHVFYREILPGMYSVSIKLTGGTATYCAIDINAYSDVSIRMGFVSPAQNDFTLDDRHGVAGLPSYFVVHVFNLPYPGGLSSVTITEDGSMAYRATLGKRYACAYESFAGWFTCKAGSTYIAKLDGIDYNGYPLRRSETFRCLQGTTTTAPTTTSPPSIVQCYNGGTLLYGNTPDAYCYCPLLYTGRSCENVLCMNGGTPNPAGSACECRDGYDGINCQLVNCTFSSGFGFLTDTKTLVFVVRASASMTSNIPAILNAAQNVIDGYNNGNYNAFANYMLVSFVNGSTQSQTFNGQSGSTNFLSALAALANSSTPGDCTDYVMGAVASVFDNIFIRNKSPIFVFTDAYASDYNSFVTILNRNANIKFPIYFFTVTPTAASGCTNDPLYPGNRRMQLVAAYTQGLSMAVDASGVYVANLVQNILFATTYKMNPVLSNDLQMCSRQPNYQTFFADSSAISIHFLATGVGMQLSVIDPNGQVINPDLQFQLNNTFAWILRNPTIGQYLLQLSSAQGTMPCSYRVSARSEYDFFYSSSPGEVFDAGYSEPVYGSARHIVATFNGQPIIDPYRQFAEITIYANDMNDARQSLYMSSGTYRAGCDFKMYFGAYNCRQPDQLLYITVYADDNLGNTIQRTAVGYCAAVEPTNSPPNTCVNGGVANPTNSTPCLCPPQYTGDYCTQIICENGGTGSSGICVCPPGTRGQFCEINTCIVTASGVNFDPNGRSLIFVLSVRASMQSALTAIANNAGEMVRDMQIASPNWISNYMIIAVNETGVMTLKNNPDPQSFVSGLQAAATYPGMADGSWPSNNCSVMLASGLKLALQNSLQNSYVFAFTDSNAQTEALTTLSLLGLAESTRATINIITTSTPVCGAASTVSGVAGALEEIVGYSGGDFYNTDDTGNFMKFIPTFYDSGLTYINYQADCSSKNLTIYFPIDGWTQSFTTAVYGNMGALTIYQPDGSTTVFTEYDTPLIQPSSTSPNMLVRQTIIPCDNFKWKARSQYCYLFEINQRNWTDARNYCHNSQIMSFMADVHSADTQTFLDYETGQLDYWIGLNSLRTQGQWEWDVPDGASYSYLDGYTNWAPGEPKNDPNLRCVQVRHSGSNAGLWYATDCSTTTLYSCQKQKYGQGLSPGEQGVNLLPQGMWRAEINTTSGFCHVQVRSQSQIQAYYGFVQDIHSDMPTQYGLFNSQSNRLATTVTGLGAINANSPEGSVNYAFMYKGNYSITRAVTLERRNLCAYQFVSQTFACPGQDNPDVAIDDFFIKFSGVDQYGNLFERFSPAYCLKQVFNSCSNGGTQYQGACICPPFFTGTTCSIPLCQNGGVQDGTKCRCPTAFTGASCELPMCMPPYPSNFHNNGKTLAIVLETSYSTGAAVFRLRRDIDTVLNQVLNGSTAGWFGNFILFPFDSSGNMVNWYVPGVYTSVADLKTALGAIQPSQCPGGAPCSSSCPRPIMTALNMTLNYPQLAAPNSQVLVITQSSPEDYPVADQVLAQIQRTGAVVSVFVTDTQSPCAMGFNSTQGRALFQLVAFSGGSVFQVSSFELTNAFMTSLLPSMYSAAVIAGGFAQNCSSQTTYVQVDQNMTDFTLDVFGANVQVTLAGPLGPISLPTSLLSSSFNYFQVVGANSLHGAGIYTVTVMAAGSECSVQVRGRSPLETFLGYTQVTDQYNGATQDDSHYAPLGGQNQQNVVLVHARGLTRGRMSYVEMAGPNGLLFTSPLARRSNCSYEFYSTNSFVCNSRTFLIAVHGWDDFGLNFRRLALGHCVDTRPTPLPPPASCNLKQRKLDLVFMLDASMLNASFQTVKTFVKTMMIAYNVSGSATQIGMMTIAATAKSQFMLSASANGGVPNLVDPVPYDGSAGQNMAAALALLSGPFGDAANGYRTDAQHLAIYITSNAGFTGGDPFQQANTIRRSGSWGIASVGYGVLSGSSNNLIQLSGGNGCFYRVGNPTDLNTNGLNFLQTTTCFDGHLCQG